MIALSYGITYIWGTVGIILIVKYLPRWWGIDARAVAAQYEKEHGVASVDMPASPGYRPVGLRAYRLENPKTVGTHGRRSSCGAEPGLQDRQHRRATAAPSATRGRRAAEGRRHRARRPARDADREDGPDRSGGRRSNGAQHPARPGRDPRHATRMIVGKDAERVPQLPRSPARSSSRRIERGGVPIPIAQRHEAAAHGRR